MRVSALCLVLGSLSSAALAARSAWTADLWGYLFCGWSGAMLNPDQWQDVLAALSRAELLCAQADTISDFLRIAFDHQEGELPTYLLPSADRTARGVWENLQARAYEGEPDDWLQRAMNHPAGKLALFWLRALSRATHEAKEDAGDRGILNPYRERLTAICSEQSQAGELGRVVLASQLHYLYAVDEVWTRTHMLPLFDWNSDAVKARQVWDGFLGWGRPTELVVRELRSYYVAGFSRIPAELKPRRDRFTEHIAFIAVYGIADPLRDWISPFLVRAEAEDRRNFAYRIGRLVGEMKADAKRGLWDRWLKRYWRQRNEGLPVAWDAGEVAQMVEWLAELDVVFAEAVDVVCNGPHPQFEHTSLFRDLLMTDLPSSRAEAVTKLLIHLTSPESAVPRYLCRNLEALLDRLIAAAVPSHLLTAACDQLARLGCPSALNLRESIRN
jgi:hypothetical protein